MKKTTSLIILLLITLLLFGCRNNEIIITFNIEGNIIDKLYSRGIVVDEDILNTITDDEVEGIFYDSNFTKEYKNNQINESTTFFIKIREEENNEKFKYEGLSLETYNQIIRDYVKNYHRDLYLGIYDDDIRITRYLGIFDGAVIASYYDPYNYGYDGDGYFFNYIWYEEIENVRLYYDNTNLYKVWKDGKFYTIKEAFTNKILTYESIIEISKILYDEIDISKIDETIKFNALCDYNDITQFTFNPSYKWPSNISINIRDKEVISDIINEFFISKNIELIPNYIIGSKTVDDIVKVYLIFKDLSNSKISICITYEGKIYIRMGNNLWLESIDKVDINWEELETYINNLEN